LRGFWDTYIGTYFCIAVKISWRATVGQLGMNMKPTYTYTYMHKLGRVCMSFDSVVDLFVLQLSYYLITVLDE